MVVFDGFIVIAENGLTMYMWIGLHVSPDWVHDVFGVQSAAQIDIDKVSQSRGPRRVVLNSKPWF